MAEIIREGLMRPFITREIEVHQPGPGRPKSFRAFTGLLKGAMYRAGVAHHFRIVDADGVMWLVPPAWLPPYSLSVAEMAMDRTDAAFLHILDTVPRDVVWRVMKLAAGIPEGMTIAQGTAWLKRRKQLELVN